MGASTQESVLAKARVIEGQLDALVRQENQNRIAIALLLLEVEEGKLFEQLGNCTSTKMYARVRFDYARQKTADLLELAKNLRSQPLIRAAAVAGEVSWKKAHLASKGAAAEPAKEEVWRDRMLEESSQELSTMLAEAQGKEPMVRFTITLSKSEATLCENALIGLQASAPRGGPAFSRREAFMAMIHRAAGSEDADRGPCTTILLNACEQCGKAWINTADGPSVLERDEFETLACDTVIKMRDGSLKRTVPPEVRRAVEVRDGGMCRVPRCFNRGWLEQHHEGGWRVVGHDPEKMYLTCFGHHTQLHRGVLSAVIAERSLQFYGADGSPLGERLDMRVPELVKRRRKKRAGDAAGTGSGKGEAVTGVAEVAARGKGPPP